MNEFSKLHYEKEKVLTSSFKSFALFYESVFLSPKWRRTKYP